MQILKELKKYHRNNGIFITMIILCVCNGILFGQSPEDYDTDVLQESLYVRITKIMAGKKTLDLSSPLQNNDKLLELNRRYYPGAELRMDTLVIPYPERKVKELSQIDYIIPTDFFNKSSSLKPDVRLSFNSSKSTLTMNKSYPMTYYRSPNVPSPSLDRISEAIEYIFNIILPYGFSQIDHKQQISGTIYFKGYIPHEIELKDNQDLMLFLECLRHDGSLYFYPSKVDDLEKYLMVYGLLYVINDKFTNLYHFGELNVIFNKDALKVPSELKLILYPFIKSIDAM